MKNMVSKKNLFVLTLLVLLVLPLAHAFAISTITTSASSSRATTGTDVTITASVTGDSSGTATQITLSGTGANTGTALSVSDPTSGYSSVSLSTSATSLPYIVSAATADTYSYSVQGTYSGGSASSSSANLEFVNPDTLTVSGTNTNTSNTVGGSFIVSVTVTNPSASQSVFTAYVLSFTSSKFALLSGDSASGTVTLNPSQSQTFTYTLNATGAVTGSLLSFSLGDNTAAFTSTVTNVANSTATTTTTTSTFTGGSSATTVPTVAPVVLPSTPPITTTTTSVPATTQQTTEVPSVVETTESAQTSPTSDVTGTFGAESAHIEVSYTAPTSGFSGELTQRLPLDYADYQAGLITIEPTPSKVEPGSIIATWNVDLAPAETFTASVDVAKPLDPSILKEFTAPTTKKSSGVSGTESGSTAGAGVVSSKPRTAQTGSDNTLFYIVGGLVLLGLLY